MLSPKESESKFLMQQLGIPTLLLWLSLNKYLAYRQDFALLPNTFFYSVKAVSQGVFGVLPLLIAVVFIFNTFFFTNFRFQDLSSTSFTLFYVMVGADSLFDTAIGTFQINFIMSVLFYMIWANFSIITIKKLTLAAVEDGYFNQKQLNESDWLRNQVQDPIDTDKSMDNLKRGCSTIFQILMKFNLKNDFEQPQIQNMKI
jgi:hypothetical protein